MAGDDAEIQRDGTEVQREMVQRYREMVQRYRGRWYRGTEGDGTEVQTETIRREMVPRLAASFIMKDLKPRLAADDETERLKATSGSRLPRAADTSQSP